MVNIIRTRKDSITSPPRGGEVGEIDTRAPFQSVKAAVSLFGDTISTPNSKQNSHRKSKSHVEGVLDKETEYHFAQKELGRCKTQVKNAEKAANKALPELEKAMKTLLDLKDKIKSVNMSTLSIIEDTEILKMKAKELEEAKLSKDENGGVGNGDEVNATRNKYKAATAELDAAKQELSGLRGDFDATMDAKLSALQIAEEAQFVAKTHSEKITQLSEEIDRMKESLDEIKLATQEQQARVKAEKEKEERVHRAAMEEVERKKAALLREKENEKLDGVETMEERLEETNREIEAVKEQVEQAKAALSESERNAYSELNAAQEELKQIERENESVQEVVNALKVEMEKVGKEIAEVREKEAQAESLTGQLKSELQEKKRELEEAVKNEGNETNACRDMVTRLEQLLLETKQAKEEAEEMNSNAEELQREIKAVEETEKKLELMMKEAEEAKAAEKEAENELRALRERRDTERATESGNCEEKKQLSKEEYSSLRERAMEPEKLVETKTATVMAEIEALKANRDAAEKRLDEILIEIEEIDRATEEAFRQAEMADAAKSMVQSELQRRRQEHQASHVVF